MRTRWIGVLGGVFLLASLALQAVGPRYLPTAFWGRTTVSMMNGGMMGSGMMGPGMMNGGMMGPGMMNGGMMNGMIDSQLPDDATRPYDQRFLDQMIVHHQNAVMMAQQMIADSQRAEMRDLAQRIITAQQGEVEQMRAWRTEWYGTASTPQEAMMQQMLGQGMANRRQMQQMMGANVDLDRQFLLMMIPHHQGAIAMAQQALTEAEHPEITQLAQTIITAQQAEIGEMQRYLRDWYGQ